MANKTINWNLNRSIGAVCSLAFARVTGDWQNADRYGDLRQLGFTARDALGQIRTYTGLVTL